MPLDFATITCPDCGGHCSTRYDGKDCPRCKGAGEVLECTKCRGKGKVSVPSAKHGAPYIDWDECPHCEGDGAEPVPEDDYL